MYMYVYMYIICICILCICICICTLYVYVCMYNFEMVIFLRKAEITEAGELKNGTADLTEDEGDG